MDNIENITEKKSRKDIKKEKKELKKQKKAERKESKEGFTYQDKKGILLVAVLAVTFIALLSFCLGLWNEDEEVTENEVTTSAVTDAPVNNTVPTAAPVSTTAAPVVTQEASTTNQSTTKAPVSTTATPGTSEKETTKVSQENTAPDKAEILDKVAKGVNSLQTDTACFKAHKTQVIAINMLDCSVPFMVDTINYVLNYFAGEKTADYDFTNGKATDSESGEEIVASHEIPPTDKPFTLTLEGVAEASVTESEKGKVYSVTVVPETSTLENPRPPFHNSACDTLDFSAFELPIGEITKADFEYPGAIISVTLDSQGNVVEYHERLDMKGSGEGNALGISGYGEFEGYVDEVWEIEWK